MRNKFFLKLISLLVGILVINVTSFSQPTISPCAKLTPIHVVVIGSSTAAGTGPTSSDSAWVNRYRKYLQSINPASQVTNLAVGGTTTYHIMPDWFPTPSGKPAVTPTKNISKALSYNPDAIIVNMPSNDGAYGFGVNEQMSNFITLYNEADTAGVQLWVCTTQPKNTSTAKKMIQTGVRDSILSYFGAYAIDFWTTIAASNNDIDSLYDSGDGTHLNNAGHRILNDRVIAKDIVNQVSDTLNYLDYVLHEMYVTNHSVCGDSNTTLTAVIANIGSTSLGSLTANFKITNNGTGSANTNSIPISSINSCTLDSIDFVINTYQAIDLSIQSYLVGTDTVKNNDTSHQLRIITVGHPTITSTNDTVCKGSLGTLSAFGTSSLDSVFWYDSLVGGSIVGKGNSLDFPGAVSSQTYYPEVVRGNLFYSNSLFTTSIASTHWNGMMFNIVANDTLTIDSIQVNINSVGSQTIIGMYRMGSYIGHEASSLGWNMWGTKNLMVASAGDFKTVDFSALTLNPNDTLGIYFYMQNSSSRLSYQNSGSIGNNVSDSIIQVLKGTGVSHTYGTSYYPRNFSGEVFYHYGYRPKGDCVSPRIPVDLVVSIPNNNLGNDTTIGLGQSLVLGTSSPGNTYLWSNSATSAQITVDTSNLLLGANTIWVKVTDQYGCESIDTIVVTISASTEIEEAYFSSIQVYPNPTHTGNITIEGIHSNTLVYVRDINGKTLLNKMSNGNTVELGALNKGVYFLTFQVGNRMVTRKLIFY